MYYVFPYYTVWPRGPPQDTLKTDGGGLGHNPAPIELAPRRVQTHPAELTETAGQSRAVPLTEISALVRREASDCLGVGADTVVLLRDLPRDGAMVSGVLPPVGSGHLVIAPAHAPDASIRRAILHLRPKRVILYGHRPGSWRPDQILARWRIRYPRIDFWSTAVHGGIMIDFRRSGLRVTPTVKEAD